MLQVLTVMAMGRLAAAIAFPAPDPTITAAPLAKRIVTTAGYRSTGFQDGSTLWGTVTYNLQGQTISTRGDQFRICNTASACNFFTCSGDYAYYSATSTYCGSSSSLTCSSDVSYTDLADKSPLTNYWCDEATLDGWAIYAATTGGDTLPASTRPSTTTTTSTSSSSSSASSIGGSSPSPTSPSPDPFNKKDKKSTPIGAIVGGVIGGLVVIGLIVVGVIFALKKKKPTPATPAMATTPATYQPPPPANYTQPAYYPPQPQQPQQSPPVGYSQTNSMAGGFVPSPEKTPAVTANAAPYYVNTDSGPTSPVPQYSAHNGAVNELPAQRM